jgi:hypothetical protein
LSRWIGFAELRHSHGDAFGNEGEAQLRLSP